MTRIKHPFSIEEMARFWSRVNRQGSIQPHTPELGNCWEWDRPNTDGYGKFSSNGKMMSAHRLAFADANNGIITGLWVLHRCDNRRCCNPSHLFEGTRQENVADMVKKGRASRFGTMGHLSNDDIAMMEIRLKLIQERDEERRIKGLPRLERRSLV